MWQHSADDQQNSKSENFKAIPSWRIGLKSSSAHLCPEQSATKSQMSLPYFSWMSLPADTGSLSKAVWRSRLHEGLRNLRIFGVASKHSLLKVDFVPILQQIGPYGKAAWCQHLGIGAVFDDDCRINQECFEIRIGSLPVSGNAGSIACMWGACLMAAQSGWFVMHASTEELFLRPSMWCFTWRNPFVVWNQVLCARLDWCMLHDSVCPSYRQQLMGWPGWVNIGLCWNNACLLVGS